MPGNELWGQEERNEVNEVLETGVLMRYGFDAARQGRWKTVELEKALAEKWGCKHVQLTSSGTSALSTALAALGVGYGHEVIMPTFTFVASFEAVLSVGATPVLVDIDDTLTLDPAAVEKAITPATRCIMPVHMCGGMAQMDELLAIAQNHNLLLLEDACQSSGAQYKGRWLGTMGHAGTLSFDYVKTITCGEGGAVLTNDADIYRKCDGYSDHGHDHLGADRGADLHPFIGYNYRMNELNAAVGLAQLRKLDTILSIQRRNKTALKNVLANNPHVSFRRLPDPSGDNASFVSWFLPDAHSTQAVVDELKNRGILAGSFYWYNNNWHYVRKWNHLTQASTLNPLPPTLEASLKAIAGQDFAQSDGIMSRCISTLITLSPNEAQMVEKGEKILEVVEMVLGR